MNIADFRLHFHVVIYLLQLVLLASLSCFSCLGVIPGFVHSDPRFAFMLRDLLNFPHLQGVATGNSQ